MSIKGLVALGCLVLSITGWLVIAIINFLFPGGHPPLAAYVTFPVMVVVIPLNITGIYISRLPWLSDQKGRLTCRNVALFGNIAMLFTGILICMGYYL